MSRYFVDDPPVAVYEFEEGTVLDEQGKPVKPNVIWIRGKMDTKISSLVKGEVTTLGPDGKTFDMRVGASEAPLLVHNILRWDGPDLGQMPCTPENILKLNPGEPHVQMVLKEITERNKATPSPNRRSPVTNTSTGAGGSDLSLTLQAALPARSEPSIPRSRLQQHLDGHLNK